ncbi:hypothetical protein Emag_000846 [Eimeria magna]
MGESASSHAGRNQARNGVRRRLKLQGHPKLRVQLDTYTPHDGNSLASRASSLDAFQEAGQYHFRSLRCCFGKTPSSNSSSSISNSSNSSNSSNNSSNMAESSCVAAAGLYRLVLCDRFVVYVHLKLRYPPLPAEAPPGSFSCVRRLKDSSSCLSTMERARRSNTVASFPSLPQQQPHTQQQQQQQQPQQQPQDQQQRIQQPEQKQSHQGEIHFEQQQKQQHHEQQLFLEMHNQDKEAQRSQQPQQQQQQQNVLQPASRQRLYEGASQQQPSAAEQPPRSKEHQQQHQQQRHAQQLALGEAQQKREDQLQQQHGSTQPQVPTEQQQPEEAGRQQQQHQQQHQQQQQQRDGLEEHQQPPASRMQQEQEAQKQQQDQGHVKKQPSRIELPEGSEIVCQAAGIELFVSPAVGAGGRAAELAASPCAAGHSDIQSSSSESSSRSSSGSGEGLRLVGAFGEKQQGEREGGSGPPVSSLAPPPVATATTAPAAVGRAAAAQAAAARGRGQREERDKAMPRDCSGSVSWRLSDSVFRQRVRAICARAVTEPTREGPGSVPPASEAAGAGLAGHARHSSTSNSSNTCCCYRTSNSSSSSSGSTGLVDLDAETPHSHRGRSKTLGREELRARAIQIEKGASTALDTPNLLDEVQYVRYKLANKALCIFLDYDGTLTPIVADPREARMSEAFRATLKRLAAVYPVAIVTGDAAAAAGVHISTGCRPKVGETSVSSLRAAVAKILSLVGPIKGLYVEDNYFAVSIHYRHCPDYREALENAVDSVLQDYPALRKCLGLELLDIRIAAQWDKGSAISWILEAMGLNGNSKELGVVYVGDDLTDEDAFRVVRAYPSGLPVVVSPRNRGTLATLHLDNVYEVRLFLEALVHFPCNSALAELRNGNFNIALHRRDSSFWADNCLLDLPASPGTAMPQPQRRAGSLTLHQRIGRRRHFKRRHHEPLRHGHPFLPSAATARAPAAPAAAAPAAAAPAAAACTVRRHRHSKRGVQSEGGGDCSSAVTSDYDSTSSTTTKSANRSHHRTSLSSNSSSSSSNSSSSSSSRTEPPATEPQSWRKTSRGDTEDAPMRGASRRHAEGLGRPPSTFKLTKGRSS